MKAIRGWVEMANPEQQGLKHEFDPGLLRRAQVEMANPEQQGLKRESAR